MAMHCCCNLCATCVSPGAATGPSEEIAGATLPPGTHGFFVQFSAAARTDLYSRELFTLPDGSRRVGISGLYYAGAAAVPQTAKQLTLIGQGGTTANLVPITPANAGHIYVTRGGALVASAELTMIVDCGGSVQVATGAVTMGTAGHERPCTAPSSCCVIM